MKQAASIACIVFSDRGKLLGEQLAERLAGRQTDHRADCRTGYRAGNQAAEADSDPGQISFCLSCAYGADKEDLRNWTKQAFEHDRVLLFIGACGIAVRAIAPLVKDKASDPAVLVMDEAGLWVIPLLSGHIGGANRWAQRVAAACSAVPVITTATDVRGVWAVDEWASRRGMIVRNPQNIKVVSAALLRGETVNVYSDVPIVGQVPRQLSLTDDPETAAVVISPYEQEAIGDQVLQLIPVCVNAGIGCRKGIRQDDIEEAFRRTLRTAAVVPDAVASLHSIDIKKDEGGICGFCRKQGLPFITHTVQELELVTDSVSPSRFVKETVGVDNVCERSALIDASTLICGKQVHNGVTVALAMQDISYDIEDVQ